MAFVKHPAEQILVATDFSEIAEDALAIAAQYARTLHAPIHLLHVSGAAGMDATQPLADVVATAGRDVSLTLVGRTGDPAEEILRYAASHAIDLIVVGTHGRTGVSRVLLGSVAERVIRGARCPVMVVPMLRPPVVPEFSMPFSVPLDDNGAEAASVERPCLVCGMPSRDLICEPCRTRIRGEVLESRHRGERAAR